VRDLPVALFVRAPVKLNPGGHLFAWRAGSGVEYDGQVAAHLFEDIQQVRFDEEKDLGGVAPGRSNDAREPAGQSPPDGHDLRQHAEHFDKCRHNVKICRHLLKYVDIILYMSTYRVNM
jgi:hypothetical protein